MQRRCVLRCALLHCVAAGYIHSEGLCIACTHNPGAAFGLFLFGILCVIALFVITNYNARLQSLLVPLLHAIYCLQFISLLSLADTDWPSSVQTVIQAASVANLAFWELPACQISLFTRWI